MGKETDNLRQLFNRRLQLAAAGNFYGEVTAVDEEARTCSVKMAGIVYENVLLYSVEQPGLKGWVMLPATGSTVLVCKLASGRYFVEMFSAIDKVMLTIGDISVQADAEGCVITAGETLLKATPNGLTFTREDAGLRKTLESLIDAITQLTVPTGTGPSGTPINAAGFTQIKQELTKYLEG